MGTEIFKIDASWAEKLTKTRVSILMTPTVNCCVKLQLFLIFQEHVLTLRLWPGGGVSGFKHDFGSSRNSSFRPHGDIFGSWTSKGICFYILFRRGDSSYGFHDIMKKVC